MNWFQLLIVRAINGSIQIGTGCWRWPWQRAGFWPRTVRAGWLCFGCWSLYRLSVFWPWVGGVAIAVLLVAGYRQALPLPEGFGAEPEATEPEPEAAEPEPEPDLSPEDTKQLLLDAVRHLADGRAGIHLEELRADWFRDGLAMELPEFRRWVESHGLRVRDSVKTRGTNRIGIRLADLPATGPRPAAATPPPTVPDDLLQDW